LNHDFINNEWIPALLSGEYKQGTGFLKKGDCYCCLGVAADLLQDQFDTAWSTLNYPDGAPISIACPIGEMDSRTQILSDRMREFVGISVSDQDHLANLNDTGHSFELIIPMIKAMQERDLSE